MTDEQQCIYSCPPGKHEDSWWVCYGERPNASNDGGVLAAIGARQERDRIERMLIAHEEDEKGLIEGLMARVNDVATKEQVASISFEIGKLSQAYTTAVEKLEHRIVVLEGQMEQARAQIQGLTLGMVTFSLDDPSREKLRLLLRGQDGRTRELELQDSRRTLEELGQGGSDDPIIPDEKGTSRR